MLKLVSNLLLKHQKKSGILYGVDLLGTLYEEETEIQIGYGDRELELVEEEEEESSDDSIGGD